MPQLTTEQEGLPRVRLAFANNGMAQQLFGQQAQNLHVVELGFDVRIHARGADLQVEGLEAKAAGRLLEQLYELIRDGYPVFPSDVTHAVHLVKTDETARLKDFFLDTIVVSARKKPIVPRSLAQKAYVEAIREYDIVFGVGPAGTGKTYLAMAMAVGAWQRKEVSRIVLARPAVEAGERLGFLPGDLADKVNPYLRPLYDALHDILDFDKVGRLIEKGVIEVAPLAFMRGRTLNDAFVILDEAQNTTSEQMKMFLTRLGMGSQAVVTGDVTQVDLPIGKASGLRQAQEILRDVDRLKFVQFSKRDVVRHPLVQGVIHAYELWEHSRSLQPGRISRGSGPMAGDRQFNASGSKSNARAPE